MRLRSLLLLSLQLALLPGSGGAPAPLSGARAHLAARAAQGALNAHASRHDGARERRLLGERRLSNKTTSVLRHNGTHMERIVDARWQCTFPQGACYSNHAPLEGLPEKMKNCTKEENKGALEVKMTIDLHCAGFDKQIRCDRLIPNNQFDPFYTCNNDPNLIQAKCHVQCGKDKRPVEVCIFNFDSKGLFNMSDETVKSCTMEAQCMSPYIEQNQMYCSGEKTTQKFKPHWVQEELPWNHRSHHGIEAPKYVDPPTKAAHFEESVRRVDQRPSVIGEVLWTAAVAMVFAGLLVVAMRKGLVARCIEAVVLLRDGGGRELKIGAPYRAPRVSDTGMRPMEYVAPAAPAAQTREAGATSSAAGGDEEDVQFMAPGT